jgi:hypothetical protein
VTLAAELRQDPHLEDAITQACTELSMATTRYEQEMIFARIGVLHRMRSPEQIARIELARGLRK